MADVVRDLTSCCIEYSDRMAQAFDGLAAVIIHDSAQKWQIKTKHREYLGGGRIRLPPDRALFAALTEPPLRLGLPMACIKA
jgi:hypothetical protein